MQLIDLTKIVQAHKAPLIDTIQVHTKPTARWLTLTRNQCMDKLQTEKLDYINFAHWLAVPALNLMLVFKQGVCCQIEQGLIA